MTLTTSARLLVLCCLCAAVLSGFACSGADDDTAGQITGETIEEESADDADAAAAAVDVAEGYLEAVGAYDADRAATYLSDGALAELWGTPKEFRLLLALLEAQRSEETHQPCEPVTSSPAGIVVRCPYDFDWMGSDELGHGPYTGNYRDVTVSDGKILSIDDHDENFEAASAQNWVLFARWMKGNHPEDVNVMYEDASQEGWRVTEESIRLWKKHIDEYVAARGSGEALAGP
jgi:hypothetical protein